MCTYMYMCINVGLIQINRTVTCSNAKSHNTIYTGYIKYHLLIQGIKKVIQVIQTWQVIV
jgi:hypothetical protein